MNVFTFISIVRPCLQEETSLTDSTCQIGQKKEQSNSHFVPRIKADYVCKPLWWPVNSKTCIMVCHYGACRITRKQSSRTHQGTSGTCASGACTVGESEGEALSVVELGVIAGLSQVC